MSRMPFLPDIKLWKYHYTTSSVLRRCWLGSRKGIWPVKNGGWWRWAMVSPDGVAPSLMVGVSASVNLPLHHEVLFWHRLTRVVPEEGP